MIGLGREGPIEAWAPMMLFAVVFGLAARGESSLIMMMVAQYYGRASYGRINGFITPFQMLGLGLGPLVASVAYDLNGSYTSVFFMFAAFFGISALCLGVARRPVLARTATV